MVRSRSPDGRSTSTTSIVGPARSPRAQGRRADPVRIVSTRIAGSLGILGETYPGYFEVGDAAGLAHLLERCEREPRFLDQLRARVIALRPLVDPARERASWRDLLRELGVP